MLNPKAGGVLGIVIGAVSIGYTWHTVHHEGQFSLALCLIGPIIFVTSLALLLLPLNQLFVPTESDGKLDYNLRNPSYTPLGRMILVLGAIASGLYFLYLKYGL